MTFIDCLEKMECLLTALEKQTTEIETLKELVLDLKKATEKKNETKDPVLLLCEACGGPGRLVHDQGGEMSHCLVCDGCGGRVSFAWRRENHEQ